MIKIKIILILILILVILLLIYYYINHKNKKNIIIPDIIGGIGNQMFIIASAFAYSKRFNKNLYIDNRKYISSYGGNRNHNNYTIFYNIPKINKLPELNKINENDYYKNKSGNIYLTNGYYQNYNYFNEYKNEILELFKPNNDIEYELKLLKEKYNMNNNNNICIHIRLKDKFTPSNHEGIYTNNEINIIKKKLEQMNGNKYIFSSDIDECRNIFNDEKGLIFVNEKDYLELYLMSYCNYYIASPSTFNWWGIYLNKNKYDIYIPWSSETHYRKDFLNKYKCFNYNI